MIFENQKETEKIFQFLGLNFKFDDIIIISILLTLYNENLQNSYIFFVLLALFFS